MNSAHGAPNSSPMGWGPRTVVAQPPRRDRRDGVGARVAMAGGQDWETSWLTFFAASARAWFGSCLPKITDFAHASRNACHTSIELGTFGTSTTCAASAAKVLYSGWAEK